MIMMRCFGYEPSDISFRGDERNSGAWRGLSVERSMPEASPCVNISFSRGERGLLGSIGVGLVVRRDITAQALSYRRSVQWGNTL